MSTQLLQECFVQVTDLVSLLENLTSRKYLTGINSWEDPSRSKTISHSRSKSSFHFFHLFFFVCLFSLPFKQSFSLLFSFFTKTIWHYKGDADYMLDNG